MNSISKTLKLSETETVIPREDLTEPTAPAPVAIKAYSECPARGLRRVKRSDFLAINPIYVLKPVCVYSSLLLRCFIHHNISFGNHITLNSIEIRDEVRQVLPRGKLASSGGPRLRRWFYIYYRLHAVRFALATVVDIGAKTDYNACRIRPRHSDTIVSC